MASQKLYPRPTLKRIMRAHSKMNVGKNVDILVRPPLSSPSRFFSVYGDGEERTSEIGRDTR